MPQYLSNRFMAKSHTLQIICAIIFFVCFTVYVASGFVAGASVFTTIFPSLSTRTAMLVFALAMFICTFFGGFKAVCWTDFFQGLLMLRRCWWHPAPLPRIFTSLFCEKTQGKKRFSGLDGW
ncbi:MAG: hypothetical protein HFE76_17155 [Firmicutes bacterium]|nr:hypothetical protein [Bacillota bacterium]